MISKFDGRMWRRKVKSERLWISSRWMEPGSDRAAQILRSDGDLGKADESLGFWAVILGNIWKEIGENDHNARPL